GLGPRVETLWGEVPDVIAIDDEGLSLEVTPRSGQKTGLYLDQRDNRARLARHLAPMTGARVLDVFSYVGMWSFAALRAGAASTLGIDSSAPAIDAARRTAERNAFTERAHFVESDAF